MSLGASGALGEALVFFGWKGLNVVREYVVPSNPKTTAQTTHRAYLTAAVAAVHAAQASTFPLKAADISAYALWGSIFATPRTWFNQVVKNWIDQKVAGKTPCVFQFGGLTPGTDKLTMLIYCQEESGVSTTMNLYYGTSKTALINVQATTRTLLMAGVEITGLTTGVKYYVQVRAGAPATFVGNRSGIFYGTPT